MFRDAIPVAFAEARGDLARWRKATEVLIDSAQDEIEGLRAFGLGQSEVQTIGRELASQGLLRQLAGGVRGPRPRGLDDGV